MSDDQYNIPRQRQITREEKGKGRGWCVGRAKPLIWNPVTFLKRFDESRRRQSTLTYFFSLLLIHNTDVAGAFAFLCFALLGVRCNLLRTIGFFRPEELAAGPPRKSPAHGISRSKMARQTPKRVVGLVDFGDCRKCRYCTFGGGKGRGGD